MKHTFIICTICLICGNTLAAEYLIAYKEGGIPAWAPADVEAYSFTDWHSLTDELKSYNPPRYPAVILRHTRLMSIQPASWQAAIDDITAQRLALLTDAECYNLQLAENALIGLLRRMEFIAPDATAIPPGVTQQVEQYIIMSAMTNDSPKVANFIARFQGLRSTIEAYGADPENAVWHTDLEPPNEGSSIQFQASSINKQRSN